MVGILNRGDILSMYSGMAIHRYTPVFFLSRCTQQRPRMVFPATESAGSIHLHPWDWDNSATLETNISAKTNMLIPLSPRRTPKASLSTNVVCCCLSHLTLDLGSTTF